MKYYLISIICLSLFCLSQTFADELVTVESVSANGQNFIIAKGSKEDIVLGQRRAFSTNFASIICNAIEIGPEHSLWEVSDQKTSVPFARGETILLHSELKDIMTEILQDKEKKEMRALIGSQGYRSFQEEQNNRYIQMTKTLERPHNIVRGSLSRGLYQSISSTDVNSSAPSSRVGGNLEYTYTQQFYNYHFEWGLGIRFDRETEKLSSPEIIVPTRRSLFTAEASYHFNKWSQTLHNFYISLGIGYGTSQSTIDNHVKKGHTFILPFAKMGILNYLGQNIYLVTEAGLESLQTKEAFIETGFEQNTSVINARINAGLRFDLF